MRATETAPDDAEDPAKYTEHQIRVEVTNVDEMGEIDILVRQPQVQPGVDGYGQRPRHSRMPNWYHRYHDAITATWQWSVPKLNRPDIDDNNHWTPAAAGTSDAASYTPIAGDVGEILRAQATYTDGTGEERTLNILTEFAVRAAPDSNDAPNAFNSNPPANMRSVDENSDEGTNVGSPVTTTDPNGDVLYYTIPAAAMRTHSPSTR